MKKRGLDFSRLLAFYDKVTGIFVDLFDTRLLTVTVTALMFYTVLFTQRKFPMRWMVFILFGMILVFIVSLTARTRSLLRVRWHKGMTALWFALHCWMLLSGVFHQDWLPEALALLLAYPFLFSVFTAREDDSTFNAVLRGCVWAIAPFLAWSYITRPLVIGYPGYYGVFYNANGLAMCCTVFSASALVLCYARLSQGKRGLGVLYAVLGLIGSATLVLTLSRSALASYMLVLTVLAAALIMGHAKNRTRAGIILLCGVIALGSVGAYVTQMKFKQVAHDDYETALYNFEHYDAPIIVEPPETRKMTLDDLTSDRYGIWTSALSNLTLFGHETAVVEEWVARDGGARRFNSHNSFVGVAYNNGWPAGILLLLYVIFSAYRAIKYFFIHKSRSPYAIAPLAFTAVFVMESLFESVYAPFSVVGCAYLLMQGVLLRADLSQCGAQEEK